MARRRVDFEDVDIDEKTSVYDVMTEGSKQVSAQKKDGTFEVITIEDAKKRKATDYNNYATNQQDIVRGSTKKRLLLQDLKLFNNFFLCEFDGINTTVDLCGEDPDNNPEYLLIQKFPLPDFFANKHGEKIAYNPDHEDVVVVITDYPDYAPFGIHIQEDSPNKDIIRKALDGHQYDIPIGHSDGSYAESVKGLKERGWIWTCFHYRGSKWSYNFNNLRKGDCLAKYLDNLFVALNGVHHPES